MYTAEQIRQKIAKEREKKADLQWNEIEKENQKMYQRGISEITFAMNEPIMTIVEKRLKELGFGISKEGLNAKLFLLDEEE